jgi:H2-forming N5,N10-methylenetetrahydromethanopterin dehydrogenase-like enzyme
MGRAWRGAAKRARALDAVIRSVYQMSEEVGLSPERVRRVTVVAGGALHSLVRPVVGGCGSSAWGVTGR